MQFFFVTDGGKEVIRKTRLALVLGIVTLTGGGITALVGGQNDTSFLKKTDRPLIVEESAKSVITTAKPSGNVAQMLSRSEAIRDEHRSKNEGRQGMKINYKATQVLMSEGVFDQARTMPMGTNLIGKTLTAIDTRQQDQLVKVLLPYGGRAQSGGELPRNAILFGQVTYNGKGDKVFIKFSKGILPTGEEFPMEAQALGSSDYSPGLVGRYHGNADMRIASTIGLTMVSGMTDALTERESMGGGILQPGSVTVKPNMKNAFYHGVSQASQAEANRRADAISQEPEYVTVEANTDVIVSLTKAYIEK